MLPAFYATSAKRGLVSGGSEPSDLLDSSEVIASKSANM